MADMRRGRSRFHGEDGALAEALQPHIVNLKWLTYSEKVGGRRDAKELVKHAALWKALRHLQPNLAFTAAHVSAAIGLCVEDKNSWFEGGDSKSKREEWIKTMPARLRAMCRDIQQTQLRAPRAAWLKLIFEDEPELLEPSLDYADTLPLPPSSSEGSTPSAAMYYVGYCREHGAAWRQPSDKPGTRDYTTNIFAPADANNTSPMHG